MTHGGAAPINAAGIQEAPGLTEQGKDADEKARDAARLQDLDARLKQRLTVEATKATGADKYSQANIAWRMVTELVAGLALGFGLGYGLDKVFGTMPIFLISFAMIGLIAGIKTMVRTAREMEKKPVMPGSDEGKSDGD